MTKRGRPPKSNIVHLMGGDPSRKIDAATKRAFEEGRLQVGAHRPVSLDKAPTTLSRPAAAIWRKLVKSHPDGTYAVTDEGQMAVYCEAHAEFNEATKMIEAEGRLDTGSTGQRIVSPWVKIRNDAAKTMASIGPTLFLTPQSREAIEKPMILDETPKGKFGIK